MESKQIYNGASLERNQGIFRADFGELEKYVSYRFQCNKNNRDHDLECDKNRHDNDLELDKILFNSNMERHKIRRNVRF